MRRAAGFTLLELMIAVIIIGVLAAIALPSYSKQIIKGNRAAAEAMLMDVAQREQQYLLDNRSYASAANCGALATSLGITVDARVSANYSCVVTAAGGPPPTFQAKATPTSSRQTPDGWLQIDNTGLKTSQYSDKW